MIDIHSHVLPGLDDGPDTMEQSLALARAAAAGRTRVMVATPHIRHDYPFDIDEIATGVSALNAELMRERIDLRIVPGGEVSVSRIGELDHTALRLVALAGGPYVLVESPYTDVGRLVETALFDLQAKGFRPVLAHPERSPAFQQDIPRLVELVRKGVLCSITASSISGRFGKTVRRFTLDLLRGGLVHDIASDTHDLRSRRPELDPGLSALRAAVPRLASQSGWLTHDVPAAILDGRGMPTRPRAMRRRLGLRLMARDHGGLAPAADSA
jgi:protein-tyrosine phosphatase